MVRKKIPFIRKSKKGDINKEVIEQIEDTKRKMNEKIPQLSKVKKQKGSEWKCRWQNVNYEFLVSSSLFKLLVIMKIAFPPVLHVKLLVTVSNKK